MSDDFHPDLAPIAGLVPEVELTDIPMIRDLQRQAAASMAASVDAADIAIEEGVLPSHDGAPDVPYRWYRTKDGAPTPMPAILGIHGGGFVVGSMDDWHHRAVQLVRDVEAGVLVIDYRLAPEHPFPAALDDATAALRWLHEQSDRLGVDPDRIAVVGESAGGALAAGLALRSRDAGGPGLCVQALLMPVLDDRGRTASMQRFTDTPMWTAGMARSSWSHYLGDLGSDAPETAAPARAVDLTGLPPAYVTCMELDPLRDEALEYARRLLDQRVSVDLRCYAGAFHGASSVPGTGFAERTHADLVEALRRRLQLPSS